LCNVGSKRLGVVLGVLGAAAIAGGVGLYSARSSYTDAELAAGQGPGTSLCAGVLGGGAAALLVGIVLGVWSDEEHYEGTLSGGQALSRLPTNALSLRFWNTRNFPASSPGFSLCGPAFAYTSALHTRHVGYTAWLDVSASSWSAKT
jgi:hypothetical protein